MERTDEESGTRLAGSDRVLAVLVQLASMPGGVTLTEMAGLTSSPKATAHRALASLTRAGLARKESRGRYTLGDEFLRLAFAYHEARPEQVRVQEALGRLTERFGETAHYAVLDGREVVYRAKTDPSSGAVRLTSTIGGRNPAHATAVGKMLLASRLHGVEDVKQWLGGAVLERRTPRTATTPKELAARLAETRRLGYAVDDQENEPGVNCIAVPIEPACPGGVEGAVSVSAVAYRTPLKQLVSAVDDIRAIVRDAGLQAASA